MALPSELQAIALGQLEGQFWSLMDSMHTWFQSNPSANATQALSYLNGLADPAPNDDVKIVDREALFNWLANMIHPYEGKANAYLSLRQFMLDHSKTLVRRLDRSAGVIAATKAEMWGKRLTSGGLSVGVDVGSISNITHTETRDPSKGNYVVYETWTATIDGVARTLRLSHTVTADGSGGWVTTPAGWSIV